MRYFQPFYLSKQLIWTLIGLTLTLTYNACGNYKTHETIAPLTSSACYSQLETTFNKTYYPFFQENCSSCHSTFSNTATGSFADPDPLKALKSMYEDEYGYPDKLELIERNALDPSHPASNSGPQHQLELETAKEQWEPALIAYDACIGSPQPVKPRTRKVPLSLALEPEDSSNYIRFELDLTVAKDLEVGADLKGAKFIFDIIWAGEEVIGSECTSELRGADGKCYTVSTAYKIKNPRITTGSDPVFVQKIDIYFNGSFSGIQTTFRSIHSVIPAGTTEYPLLPAGSSPLLLQPVEGFHPTDTLSFEFANLEVYTSESSDDH